MIHVSDLVIFKNERGFTVQGWFGEANEHKHNLAVSVSVRPLAARLFIDGIEAVAYRTPTLKERARHRIQRIRGCRK